MIGHQARQVDDIFNLLDSKGLGTLNLRQFRVALREIGRGHGLFLYDFEAKKLFEEVHAVPAVSSLCSMFQKRRTHARTHARVRARTHARTHKHAYSHAQVDSEHGIEVAEMRFLARRALQTIPKTPPYFQNRWNTFDFFTLSVQARNVCAKRKTACARPEGTCALLRAEG